MSDTTNAGAASDANFQWVLDAFLRAYRPVLEHELRVGQSAETLLEASREHPPTTDEEIRQARALFERFFTPDVATKLLPAEGQAAFGSPDQWEWCYRHILCCLVFGWLVCRGPRTFRGFAYYLYQYWICVRQALGEPVSDPPTAEQKRDFAMLVRILSTAYGPSIRSQVRDLEYPIDIPKDIESGKIGRDIDANAAKGVFERLLSAESAPALLGKAAFAKYGNEPISRNCRCYCISALEFGCCLARTRTLVGAVECLEQFFVRNQRCFDPLIAEIDTPPACSTVTLVAACSNLTGIEILGAAAGGAFTNYTLTYSVGGSPAINTAVVYPNCSAPPAHPSESTPVTSGVLGYLNIGLLPPATSQATVYLDVYGAGGLHLQVSAVFQFAVNSIAILDVGNVTTANWQDPFDTSPSIVKMVQNATDPAVEQSIGGNIWVTGCAYTYGCGNQMTQYQLVQSGKVTFNSGTGKVILPLPVPAANPSGAAGTPLIAPVVYDDTTAHPWSTSCLFWTTSNAFMSPGDLVARWTTETCGFFPFQYTAPVITSNQTWASGPSGRYIVFLEVDQAPIVSPHTPVTAAGEDWVVVWIDNYTPVAQITQIGGVIGCGNLNLSAFYQTGPGGVNQLCPVIGVAWDAPIDANAAQQVPNDNFDSYALTYQKNGVVPPQPFLAADYAPNGVAGTPTVRVPNLWQAAAPNPAIPAQTSTLALWDIITALDAGGPVVNPSKPWQLPRGQQCAYVLSISASDTTLIDNAAGTNSIGPVVYGITIVNDIP
jgi:hypothetical protein